MLNNAESKMQTVKIVEIEDAGFYSCETTCGSTVKVTLQCGKEFATCDGILIWEDELANDDTFEEWVDCAIDGIEGYSAILVENGKTVTYGK
jgi:hypothetical protein